MLRQRRRRLSFTSDSSDDGAPQPKKQFRSSNHTQTQSSGATLVSGTRKRHLEDDSCSSDSSIGLQPMKQWKKLPVSTSEESSTSDNDEILHPARRGALRALSDYETGDSSDKVSEAGSSRDQGDRTNLNETDRFSEADSLDSGIPIGFRKPRNHRRISISSEESDSPEPFDNEPNTVESRGNTAVEESVRPTTSRNSLVQQTRRHKNIQVVRANRRKRRIHHASEVEFDSDSESFTTTTSEESDSGETSDMRVNKRVTRSVSSGAASYNSWQSTTRQNRAIQDTRRSTQYRSNDQTARPSRTPWQAAVEDESSSDSIIRPSPIRSGRIPVFDSETSSSDESDDEVIPIRRGARVAIRESDEDMDVPAMPITYNEDSVVTADGGQVIVNLANSSDSDGESEKCPICLVRFGAQEVGNPSSCDHCFCLACIQQWAKNKNTCPVDRHTFNSISVRNNIHSKVSRKVKVETPPEKSFWEAMDLLENIAASLIFATEEISFSEYESNEDLDGPEEICCVCRRSNNSNRMILCDSCNRVYHLGCVNPPLHTVPGHEWFCPNC